MSISDPSDLSDTDPNSSLIVLGGATDSNGNDAGRVISLQNSTSNEATPITLSGGAHTYAAITGGKNYRVVSDVDVFLRSSTVSSVYGAEMTLNTDYYSSGSTDWSSNAEMTGFLASNSDAASIELWIKKDGTVATTNNDRPVSFGKAAASEFDFIFYPTGGFWRYQLVLIDATNTSVINNAVTTTVSSDTDLHHVVMTVDRAADTVELYIDGSLADSSTSVGGTAGTCTFNTTAMLMNLGATIANAANADGSIYDFKLYKSALTAAQISNRNARGMVATAADLYRDTPTSIDPVLWYNFQDSASWADPTQPEPVSGYGTTPDMTLDTLGGTPAIVVQAGGEPATTATSAPVIAGNQEIITTASADAYLNVYTKPGVTGTIWLTEL